MALMKQCYDSRREYIISETEKVTVTSILCAYPACHTCVNLVLVLMCVQSLQLE